MALGSRSPAICSIDELVVRHVAIEGVDDPIAVEPDEARRVFFVAVGIGVAGGVEPDARPALAIVGRGEQTVDLLLVGVGAAVGEESVELGGSGREAGEVEAGAAEQRGAVGFGRGLQTFAIETREQERVDGVAHPIRAAGGRDRGTDRRDEGPVAGGSGQNGAGVDPFGERGDLVGGERGRAHGHARQAVGAGDALDQQAVGGVTGRDDFARAGIEPQAAHLLAGAVAAVAGFGEDGLGAAA